MPSPWPRLGCGAGLRSLHYPVITQEWPRISWFEAISENYMDTGGRPLAILEKVREHYPLALHGTALSIGSIDAVNIPYLTRLKSLIERIDPFIVSDHLCGSGVGGNVLHDLLPLPFTGEAIRHTAEHLRQVQEFLGRQILIENVSTYVTYRHSVMPEWEFLAEVAKRSGCGILLDLNNIYVNSVNHGFDPYDYVRRIPRELVGQFHLGGHTDMGTFLFDTHSKAVIDPVWDLYREALKVMGPVSTLIEWDADIPPFEVLSAEVKKAQAIYDELKDVTLTPIEVFAPRPAQGTGLSNRDLSLQTSLPAIQNWMRTKIQPQTEESADRLSPEPYCDPKGEEGKRRIAAYTGGYPARFHESLSEVYETIRSLLGPERFMDLAHDYAVRYPSRDHNLNFVGRHLPEFLKTSKLTKEFPFLSDLARLEWLISEAFHSFERPPVRPEEMTSIPPEQWEDLRLTFQPSTALLSSFWPVFQLWTNRKSSFSGVSTDRSKSPEHILVGRRGLQIRAELLDPQQFRLLEALLAGKDLGAACEVLAEGGGDELPPITEWFSRWIQDGLIADLDQKGISFRRVSPLSPQPKEVL